MPHPPPADPRTVLAATRAGIDRDLAIVAGRWRTILKQAETAVRNGDPGFCIGRGNTRWRVYHEQAFQQVLRVLALREEKSARAILARVRRARVQQKAQARRLRVNEPWQLDRQAVMDVRALFRLIETGHGPVTGLRGMAAAAAPPP